MTIETHTHTHTHRTYNLRATFYSRTLLKTIAREADSQIALRNYSKESKAGPMIYMSFSCRGETNKHVIEHQKTAAKHRKTDTSS